MELTFDIKPINVGQLEGEMRAAFPSQYKGLSTDQESIRFFVDEDFSESDQAALAALYEAHTPTETDEQTVNRKRTARQELRQALRDFDKSKVTKFADLLPYLESAFKLLAQDD